MWRALRVVPHLLAPALVSAAAAAAPAAGSGVRDGDAPFPTTFARGLTGPSATCRFFTTALDLEAPLLLRGSADFMSAARADGRERLQQRAGGALGVSEALVEVEVREHLERSSRQCSEFLDSGAVHDCEEIRAMLHNLLAEKGQLALLLGGKSVGKSLLLQELARQRKDIVGLDGARRALLYVDARSCGDDLAAGLVAALQREALEQQRMKDHGYSARQAQAGQPALLGSSLLPAAKGASIELSFKGAALGAQPEFAGPASKVDQCLELLGKVSEAAQTAGYYLCLIVDEANLTFPAPPDPLSSHPAPPLSPTHLHAQRQLEKLVQLTKQSRQMNVLLVSSEYAYPYRLRHGRFFNTSNLTETMFAGEVPPAAMRQLLQRSWGLGPRLADVFLAFYGGHVHMASRALAKLREELDDFNCEEVAPDGVLGPIVDCIEGEGGAGPMADMLRALAGRGFAPVSSEGNAQAQALSLANAGGLVKTSGKVVGLPLGLRRGANFGVVPSSHFTVRCGRGYFQRSSPCAHLHLPIFPLPLAAPPYRQGPARVRESQSPQALICLPEIFFLKNDGGAIKKKKERGAGDTNSLYGERRGGGAQANSSRSFWGTLPKVLSACAAAIMCAGGSAALVDQVMFTTPFDVDGLTMWARISHTSSTMPVDHTALEFTPSHCI